MPSLERALTPLEHHQQPRVSAPDRCPGKKDFRKSSTLVPHGASDTRSTHDESDSEAVDLSEDVLVSREGIGTGGDAVRSCSPITPDKSPRDFLTASEWVGSPFGVYRSSGFAAKILPGTVPRARCGSIRARPNERRCCYVHDISGFEVLSPEVAGAQS